MLSDDTSGIAAAVEMAKGADEVILAVGTDLSWVSRHDIAGIWVAFFSRHQRYRC